MDRIKSALPEVHPLDACDPTDMYRWYTDARQKLVDSKKQTEENLIADIVKISAASLLVIPAGTAIFVKDSALEVQQLWIIVGIFLLTFSLVLAVTSRLMSANAYAKTEQSLKEFYEKRSAEVTMPKFKPLKMVLYGSVICFLLGLISFIIFLWHLTGVSFV